MGEKIRAGMESENAGGKEILSFAKKTGSKIRGIVKRAEIRKKFWAIFPVLVVILIVAANVFWQNSQQNNQQNSQQAESIVEEKNNVVEELAEKIWEWGKEEISSGEEQFDFVTIVLLFIVIVLLIVVVYRIYLKWLENIRRVTIAKKSAAYLEREILAFEQSHRLKQALDEIIKSAVEEYEQEHLQLLITTLALPEEKGKKKQEEDLKVLLEEWKNIR